MSTCRRCSHDKVAHEHYRQGSDCSACTCAKFSSVRRPSLASFLHRHAAPTLVETAPQGTTAAA